MGVSRLYLFKFNGKNFVPKQDLAVMHLSEVSAHKIHKCGPLNFEYHG